MSHTLSYRIGALQRPNLPLDRVAALGIGGLELTWNEETTVDAVRRAVEAAGLRVTSVQVPGSLDDDDLPARLSAYAEKAAQLDAGYLFISLHAGDMDREEAYARLRRAGDAVAPHQVFLALETHPDLCQNAAGMLQTMAAVSHPWVGINFDTANIYYYNEGVDGLEELRQVAAHVRGVHLKDTRGGFHDGDFPVFGEGIVDFAGVGAVLDSAGYEGPYCMELEGRTFDPRQPAELEAKIERCVTHLRLVGLVD